MDESRKTIDNFVGNNDFENKMVCDGKICKSILEYMEDSANRQT